MHRTRTHDPLAMQKVVGSSPIIRFKNPAQAGVCVAADGNLGSNPMLILCSFFRVHVQLHTAADVVQPQT